jgi:folate-dependent phosphoribosylglycinamide formyltransferase PurN
MRAADRAVAILAVDGAGARSIHHHLVARGFRVERVVLERPMPRLEFLRRRVKRLGLGTVLGQLAFRAGVVPLLNATSRARVAALRRTPPIDERPIPLEKVVHVESANSPEAIAALREVAPAAVVVYGTRIIAPQVLRAIAVPFLNAHTGITPRYRGAHGAYWALAEGDAAGCGVTVHLVDEGIDTGPVLGQAIIRPTRDDNFVTYPLLQVAAVLPVLSEALEHVLAGEPKVMPPATTASRLRTHPTLWQYAWRYVTAGVK